MELKDFIENTLTSIFEGIEDAINKNQSNRNASGCISPFYSQPASGQDYSIDFDIAVTTSSEKEGGGKVKIASFGVGAQGKKIAEQTNRIHFSVPVQWPSEKRKMPG